MAAGSDTSVTSLTGSVLEYEQLLSNIFEDGLMTKRRLAVYEKGYTDGFQDGIRFGWDKAVFHFETAVQAKPNLWKGTNKEGKGNSRKGKFESFYEDADKYQYRTGKGKV